MHGFLFKGGGGGTVQLEAFGRVSPPTQSLPGDVYASLPVPVGLPAHSSHDLQFCGRRQTHTGVKTNAGRVQKDGSRRRRRAQEELAEAATVTEEEAAAKKWSAVSDCRRAHLEQAPWRVRGRVVRRRVPDPGVALEVGRVLQVPLIARRAATFCTLHVVAQRPAACARVTQVARRSARAMWASERGVVQPAGLHGRIAALHRRVALGCGPTGEE